MEAVFCGSHLLPPAPVRPATLDYALTHGGRLMLSGCRLVAPGGDEEEWQLLGGGDVISSSACVPAPSCLGALSTILPPVTVEEFECADSVLALVSETGSCASP